MGIYRVTQEERLTNNKKSGSRRHSDGFGKCRQVKSPRLARDFCTNNVWPKKNTAVCGWDDQPCYTGDVASNPTFATNKRPTSTTSIKPEVWKALPATYLIHRQNDKIYRNSPSVNSLQLAAQYLRFSWKSGAVPGPGATHSHWLFGGHGSSVFLI